jgi:hypothetical protein
METMKVYCKNCKFFRHEVYCVAPQLGVEENYIAGKFRKTVHILDSDYPNLDGECKYYKPDLFQRIKEYYIKHNNES